MASSLKFFFFGGGKGLTFAFEWGIISFVLDSYPLTEQRGTSVKPFWEK